jgi:hypothetical protein
VTAARFGGPEIAAADEAEIPFIADQSNSPNPPQAVVGEIIGRIVHQYDFIRDA